MTDHKFLIAKRDKPRVDTVYCKLKCKIFVLNEVKPVLFQSIHSIIVFLLLYHALNRTLRHYDDKVGDRDVICDLVTLNQLVETVQLKKL